MIKVEKLYCRVGNFLLKEITFNIQKNDYFILLGPTGSGKTTLARCICGLYPILKGKIFLNNKDITALPPEKRGIGYLPQNFALFPHMDVRNNILFGIKIKKISFDKVKKNFERITEILKINHLFNRKIDGLSGGEKQRVALARALLVEPKLLILDEPFSSIDVGLKRDLWFEMKDILKKFDTSIIHITHNLDEASILGTKIALLINGRIIQKGKKDKVFSKPKNEMVARYLGIRNIYSGIIEKIDKEKIIIKGERFRVVAFKERNFKEGEEVRFSIAPQDIKIIKEGIPIREELRENIFKGEIVLAHFLKNTCIIRVRSEVDFELEFPSYIYKRHNLFIGKKIKIGIWQKGISIFRKEDL